MLEGNFNLEINHISQFDEILKNKEEIRCKKEMVGDVEFSIICYMIAMPNTFESLLSRECRGITFNDKGEVVSRPFHKFFNIGEKEFTQPHLLREIKGYKEKVDGSLAIPVLVKDKILWKTKKSFYSYIAKDINKLYYPEDSEEDIYNPDKKCTPYYDTKLDWTLRDMLSRGITPLFEYLSPTNRIVIKHSKECLYFLNTRNNKTGDYSQMTGFLDDKFNLENFIKETLVKEEIEGYVLYDDKDFYKLKTTWYTDRHRALDVISVRDLVDLILRDELDDVVATLNNLGCIERIQIFQKYSEEVLSYMLAMEKEAKEKFQLYNGPNRKEFAEKVKQERPPLRAVIFDMKSGNYENTLKKMVGYHFKEKYKNKIIQFGVDE